MNKKRLFLCLWIGIFLGCSGCYNFLSASVVDKKVFRGHVSGVFAIALSPDGTLLATSSRDKIINVWDVETGVLLWKLTVSDAVKALAFNYDNTLLAVSSSVGSVSVWDVQTGVVQKTFSPLGIVESLAFKANGQMIAVAFHEGVMTVVNLDTGKSLYSCCPERILFFSRLIGRPLVKLSVDGLAVMIEGSGQTVEVRDSETGCAVFALSPATMHYHLISPLFIGLSPRIGVLSSVDRANIYVFDVATKQCICEFAPSVTGLSVCSLALNLDGTCFAFGCGDGSAMVITDTRACKSKEMLPWSLIETTDHEALML